jgi:flagellar basal body-associated protein FliL
MTSFNQKKKTVQFSGNELDDAEGEAYEAFSEGKFSTETEEQYTKERKLSLWLLVSLCFLAGTGIFYLYAMVVCRSSEDNKINKKVKVFQIDKPSAPKNYSIDFDSFIIPCNQYSKYTYISLSISFALPNKELKQEMLRSKDQLRGIIYDIVKEKVNKPKEFPSLEILKEFIIISVNQTLLNGQVDDIYITDFLSV